MKKSNSKKISDMLRVVEDMMVFPGFADASYIHEILANGFKQKAEHMFATYFHEKEEYSESLVEVYIESAKKYEKIAEMIDIVYFDDDDEK